MEARAHPLAPHAPRGVRALAAARRRPRDARRGPARDRRGHAARARRLAHVAGAGPHPHRRGDVPQRRASWSPPSSSSRSARTACSPTAAWSPTPTTASTTRTSRSPGRGSPSKGPTRIGDNVWLGANVVVTSGVTIGERCVIGANSVVTQDIPPFSIAAGAPAKVLRAVTYGEAGVAAAAVHAPGCGRAATARAAAAPSPSAAEARAQRDDVVDVAARVVEHAARADRVQALVVAGRGEPLVAAASRAAGGRGTPIRRARCPRPSVGFSGPTPRLLWTQFHVPGMTCMIPRAFALDTTALLKPLSCQAIAAASDAGRAVLGRQLLDALGAQPAGAWHRPGLRDDAHGRRRHRGARRARVRRSAA